MIKKTSSIERTCPLWLILIAFYAFCEPSSRPFYMGFTPFPHDISEAALTYTEQKLDEDGDIIAHHLDNGIPWPEALSGEEFSSNIIDDWNYRKLMAPEGHAVYLATTPISSGRDNLALYRGDSDDMALFSPWDTMSFDNPSVVTAYTNYCKRTIDFFEPDFYTIGIEVNGLILNNPQSWDNYVRLQEKVYTSLKEYRHDLPIMISLVGVHLLQGWSAETDYSREIEALGDIMPYSDYLGISLYPYMSSFLADSLPEYLFDSLAALTDKPLAVCECGYPADTFDIYDNEFIFKATEKKQNDFISLMLTKAEQYDFRFVINFIVRDYDSLWTDMGQTDILALWKDTGLYDEAGSQRPAMTTWKTWLAKPRHTVFTKSPQPRLATEKAQRLRDIRIYDIRGRLISNIPGCYMPEIDRSSSTSGVRIITGISQSERNKAAGAKSRIIIK